MHHSLEQLVSTGLAASVVSLLYSQYIQQPFLFCFSQENLQKPLGMSAAYPKSLQFMVLNVVASAENEEDIVWINTCVLTSFSSCCSEGSQGATHLHHGPDQCEEHLSSTIIWIYLQRPVALEQQQFQHRSTVSDCATHTHKHAGRHTDRHTDTHRAQCSWAAVAAWTSAIPEQVPIWGAGGYRNLPER